MSSAGPRHGQRFRIADRWVPRRHYLASTGPIPFGVGGWFHAARSTAHILNQTVSTVRSAYALKDVYEEIQKKEQEGTLTEEEKRKLEDKAAQMVRSPPWILR